MNGTQTGFVKFINQLQMASFGSFAGEVRWTIISLIIGVVDAWLLTRESEAMRGTGLAVLGILVGALVTKTVASVVSNKNVRDSSRESWDGKARVVEAEARGKAIGEATAEHAALPPLHVDHADKVEQTVVPEPLHRRSSELPTPSAASMELDTVEHEWARGDPREGIL